MNVIDVFHLMRSDGRCQIDCRLSRCTFFAENSCVFGRKRKKRNQRIHFRPKSKLIESSQSPYFRRRKRKRNSVSLYFLLFSRQRSLRDFGISCFLQLLPVCFQHMLTAEDRVTDSITQGIYYAFSSCVYIV